MTCEELHDYWESDLRVAISLLSDSAELAEHVATCPKCDLFITERKELEKQLHLVSSAGPEIPPSLDNAVLANYRRYMAERPSSAVSNPVILRTNSRTALGWAAAMAFAVVVAYGGTLLFIPRQHVWVDRQDTARQPVVPQAQRMANKETARTQEITRKAPRSDGDSVKRANPASLAERDNSFPARFQSLMYCDQISCPGAMDVIRVQLPSPVLGLTPASARTNGAVSADVLVGPDGIARGIRVVE